MVLVWRFLSKQSRLLFTWLTLSTKWQECLTPCKQIWESKSPQTGTTIPCQTCGYLAMVRYCGSRTLRLTSVESGTLAATRDASTRPVRRIEALKTRLGPSSLRTSIVKRVFLPTTSYVNNLSFSEVTKFGLIVHLPTFSLDLDEPRRPFRQVVSPTWSSQPMLSRMAPPFALAPLNRRHLPLTTWPIASVN